MKANYKLADYGKAELKPGQEAEGFGSPLEGFIGGGFSLGLLGAVPAMCAGFFFGGLISTEFPGTPSLTEWIERQLNFKGCSRGAGWKNYMADCAIYTETGIIATGAIMGYRAEK